MFELVFVGYAYYKNGKHVRWRRHHLTFEAAETAAIAILAKMDNRGAHPAIIYGPGLSKDGKTIR